MVRKLKAIYSSFCQNSLERTFLVSSCRTWSELFRVRDFCRRRSMTDMKAERHASFRNLAERQPAHAGSAYPDEPDALRSEFDQYFKAAPKREGEDGAIGIAAPHVSPIGGWRS